jgi:hypothetical protein
MRVIARAMVVMAVLAAMAVPMDAMPSAAGTVTVSQRRVGDRVFDFTFAWTSDASGDVNGNRYDITFGSIIAVRFIPSASAAPTDNYDVTLLDQNSVDMLGGTGANRDTANTEVNIFSTPLWYSGRQSVDLVVSAAGNAKSGTVVISIRQPN